MKYKIIPYNDSIDEYEIIHIETNLYAGGYVKSTNVLILREIGLLHGTNLGTDIAIGDAPILLDDIIEITLLCKSV